MSSLDAEIIIGMDFLSNYRASIDCFKRQVILFTPEGNCLRFKSDWLEPSPSYLSRLGGKDYFYSVISTLSAVYNIAHVVDLPLVVCEFLDDFFGRLTGFTTDSGHRFFH